MEVYTGSRAYEEVLAREYAGDARKRTDVNMSTMGHCHDTTPNGL